MSTLNGRNWLWMFAYGMLSLSLAVYVSTLNPPSEYELSMYAGPPWFVWVLIGTAMVVSVVLAVYGKEARSRHAGLVLSTSTVVVIGTLPLLRSYQFFGRFDALNHLGKLHDVLAGVSANTTIYPAIHLLSAVIVRVTGLSPEVALLVTTPVFVLLFALGLYSIVLHWGVSSLGKAVTGIVPLTLPFLISVRLPSLQPLPTVAALLMFPLLLYLLFNGLQARRRFTICFLVIAASHVFYHPQHALVLALGIFLGNLIVMLSPLGDSSVRPRFGFSVFIGTLLGAWLYLKPGFWGAVQTVLSGIESDTGVVEGASPSGENLETVGGSLVEIGIKVFGPKLALLLGLVVLSSYLFVRLDGERRPSNKELYLGGLLLAAGLFVPLFAVAFARSQMFRYVGTGMIFIAVLLSVYNSERVVPRYHPGVRHLVAVLLLVSALTTLPIAYQSPYVYQPGDHVTEGEFDGYEFVFENQHSRPLRTFGTDQDRYRNALYGRAWPAQAREANVEGITPTRSYVTNRTIDEANGTFLLTEYTRARWLRLYPELGYSEADFEYVESAPEIHKLYANGGTAVYAGRRGGDPE